MSLSLAEHRSMLTTFKKPERFTGIILEHSHVTVVELTHTVKGYALTAAGSYESQMNFDNPGLFSGEDVHQREKAFAGELKGVLRKLGANSQRFSFGLNTGMLMLQTIPMDMSLTDAEQKEQALWELRHFADESTGTSHSVVIHRLAMDAATNVAPTVVVGVRKAFVAFLNATASLLKGSLHILDVQHFCAENALMVNYPMLSEKRALMIGMDDTALTASTIVDGASIDVQIRPFTGDDSRMLYDFTRSTGAEQIFLHGSGASFQTCESLKRSLDIPVALIDPFRVVVLPASLNGLADIKARRHEFTAAVGLAMRTE
jgi:Tfp pilus assembly PilM family ATPase